MSDKTTDCLTLQNILRSEPSVSSLIDCFSAPRPLLPPLGDAAWQRVAVNPLARNWLTDIRRRALSELHEALPALTDEMYADYRKTGIRLRFERVYFERRRQLARAAIAALTESDAQFRRQLLDSMVNKAHEILAEESWALPAHVSTDSGKNAMTIDLFGAETANLFGELLNLFPNLLARDRILQRLKEQFFDNYLTHSFGWMTATHNWNAVCHQGVLGAALAVVDDPHVLAELFMAARGRLAIFLSGFAPDGGCSEGPAYWGYGFGWMVELNHQLETRTAGRLSLFDGDDHVPAIARYGPRMTLSHGWMINFADCTPDASPRPALLEYLAGKFSDPMLRAHADAAWRQAAGKPISLDLERADLFHFSRQLLRCPTSLPPATELPVNDELMPDLSVAVCRFRDDTGHLWEFACKGGNNAEHHNHNDLGSYLLNIDGSRMLTEIGAPEYVGSFFGPKRYESIASRSLGHPVPRINGFEQPVGAEFHATLNLVRSDAKVAILELDLTAAYPSAAGCKRCRRMFQLDKRLGRLTVTDHFELTTTSELETALITESSVTAEGRIEGTAQTIRVSPGTGTRLKEIQTHPFSDHDGHPAVIHRLVLIPDSMAKTIQLSYSVERV